MSVTNEKRKMLKFPHFQNILTEFPELFAVFGKRFNLCVLIQHASFRPFQAVVIHHLSPTLLLNFDISLEPPCRVPQSQLILY